MRDLIRRHETGAFVALTFGLSWPLWFLSGVLGRADFRAPDLSWVVAQVGVFAPALAGLLVAACIEPGAGRRALRTLLLVYLPATALAIAIATRGHASLIEIGTGETIAVAVLGIWVLVWFAQGTNRVVARPGESARASTVALWTIGATVVPAALFVPCWLGAAPSAVVASTGTAYLVRELTPLGIAGAFAVNLSYGGSLGEEPGWRGVWLPLLLRQEGPLAASLTIGVCWALWHAPIDLAQGLGLSGIGALVVRVVWTLPVAVIFTWVTLRAGGSLLPVFALHTTVNVLPDFGMKDPVRYERAMSLYFVMVIIFGIVIVFADRRLRPRTGSSAARDGR